MAISTYQIRNVLKVYGNQLKRRSHLIGSGSDPEQPSSDFVSISVEARKKQVFNQLSHKLISELRPNGSQQKVSGRNIIRQMPSLPLSEGSS
jgi:hypothetical protein